MQADSITPRNQRGTVVRLCHQCGNFFWSFKTPPGRPHRIYCDPECSAKGRVTPLAVRFWAHVVKTDHCWLWTGAHDNAGYGRIAAGGHQGPILQATHASWLLHFGPVPPGLQVHHDCSPLPDNPNCVNPAHLSVGDQGGNMRAKVAKGRQPRGDESPARKHPELMPRGSSHHNAKLTEQAVRELRQRYAAGDVTFAQLAADYGISVPIAHAVYHRRIWKHIE